LGVTGITIARGNISWKVRRKYRALGIEGEPTVLDVLFSRRLEQWKKVTPAHIIATTLNNRVRVKNGKFETQFDDAIRKVADGVWILSFAKSQHIFERGGTDYMVFSEDHEWDGIVRCIKDFSKLLSEKYEVSEDHPEEPLFLAPGIKEDIFTDFERFMESRDKYVNDMGVPWKRGYVFIGAPGLGKSLTIRQLCAKYNLVWCDLKESIDETNELDLDYAVPDTIDMTLYPRTVPEVLVLEDLDKFVVAQGAADYSKLSLHDLLKSLDGVKKREGFLIIATTNRADEISDALMNRPGRFDRIWKFDMPDKKRIIQLLECRNIKVVGGLDKVAEKLGKVSMAFVDEFAKSMKMVHGAETVKFEDAEVIINRIHAHMKMFKDHFKDKDSNVGF